MTRRRLAPLTVALALALAGCGQAGAPRGAAVFAQECQVCHSLIGNESRHKDGGDLLGYAMTERQLTSFVREMPVRRRLSSRQLRAVVSFVHRAEQRARH